jgi:hypothetical protein
VNDTPHSVEHLTAPEIDNVKVGREQRKILGLQSGPELVRARICFRSIGHDDIVTPVQMTRMRADRLSGAGSHRHFRE